LDQQPEAPEKIKKKKNLNQSQLQLNQPSEVNSIWKTQEHKILIRATQQLQTLRTVSVSLTSKNAKKATKRKEMIKKENQDLLRMMDSRPKENKDNPRIIHSKKLRRMISKW